MKFWALEFWTLRLGILIMKSEVWIFENWRFEFKIWALRMWNWKLRNENFLIENLDFERYLETLKKNFFFFFLVDWVNSVWLSWLNFWLSLSVGAEILAPPFFVSSLFAFLLHLPTTYFLHWHFTPFYSPWFLFFISPLLLTKNTFLSFLTLPHPSPSIFF